MQKAVPEILSALEWYNRGGADGDLLLLLPLLDPGGLGRGDLAGGAVLAPNTTKLT